MLLQYCYSYLQDAPKFKYWRLLHFILLHVDRKNVKLFSKVTNDIAILKIRGHSTFLSILKFQKSS